MIAGSWLIASVHIDLTNAEVVGDLAMMGQEVAEPGARLAMLGELEVGAGERDRRLLGAHAGEPLGAADFGGELLAVFFVEQRFVVEEVLLGGAAGLEEVDDAFRLRGEGRGGGERIGEALLGEQGGERGAAETGGRGAEEVATGEALQAGVREWHG